jgi:hypothetical protein
MSHAEGNHLAEEFKEFAVGIQERQSSQDISLSRQWHYCYPTALPILSPDKYRRALAY